MTARPSEDRHASRRIGPALTVGLTCVAVVAVGGILLIDAVRAAREVARASVCRGHLCQLTVALNSYHHEFGCLPPAIVRDAQGRPMHSWRILLLPFMDGQDLYDRYRFDEPWDSAHNLQVAKSITHDYYRCPSARRFDHPELTNYVAISGPGTAFPDDGCVSLDDLTDGVENTLLIIEIHGSDILWTEPRDWPGFPDRHDFQESQDAPRVLSHAVHCPHTGGPGGIFADTCTGYRLNKSLSRETCRALATIAGNEPVTRKSLVRRDQTDGPQLVDAP